MQEEPYDTRSLFRPATSALITVTEFPTAVATSTALASATTSAFSGGRPLFVGMNIAVAPWLAIALPSSGKLESLQINTPNVNPLTVKTGVRSPARYTDVRIAGYCFRYRPATEPCVKTTTEL